MAKDYRTIELLKTGLLNVIISGKEKIEEHLKLFFGDGIFNKFEETDNSITFRIKRNTMLATPDYDRKIKIEYSTNSNNRFYPFIIRNIEEIA